MQMETGLMSQVLGQFVKGGIDNTEKVGEGEGGRETEKYREKKLIFLKLSMLIEIQLLVFQSRKKK